MTRHPLRACAIATLLFAMPAEAAAQDDTPDALFAQEDLEWVEVVPGISFAAAHGKWTRRRTGSSSGSSPAPPYGDAAFDLTIVEP
jgi:hypothetical protein